MSNDQHSTIFILFFFFAFRRLASGDLTGKPIKDRSRDLSFSANYESSKIPKSCIFIINLIIFFYFYYSIYNLYAIIFIYDELNQLNLYSFIYSNLTYSFINVQ